MMPAVAEPTEGSARAGVDLVWFLYGVVQSGSPVPHDLTGLDNRPVVLLEHGRVAAVATQIAIERSTGKGVDLLAYHSVLDALAHDRRPVLPVLFGTVLPDEPSIIDQFLAPDEAVFDERLRHLENRSQFVLQAVYDEQHILSEVVSANREVADLRARTKDLPEDTAYGERVRLGELVGREVDARRHVDSASVLEQILPVTDAHVLRPVSGLERVVDAAVLVHDQRREQFEHRLEVLAEELHPRVRLRLMGPTAAYDFTGGV
jgi:hypothetical protein